MICAHHDPVVVIVVGLHFNGVNARVCRWRYTFLPTWGSHPGGQCKLRGLYDSALYLKGGHLKGAGEGDVGLRPLGPKHLRGFGGGKKGAIFSKIRGEYQGG